MTLMLLYGLELNLVTGCGDGGLDEFFFACNPQFEKT